MKVTFKSKGNFENTTEWLSHVKTQYAERRLNEIGDRAIDVLRSNSPVDTGELRDAWAKEVKKDSKGVTLSLTNTAHSNEVTGLVYLIEYGHGTNRGGYVPPNPFVQRSMTELEPYISEKIEGLIENGR